MAVRTKFKPNAGVGELLADLNSVFGNGSAATLENDTKAQILHWCSFGCFNLDEATGWGIPGGRITELFGPESSGKTTMLMAAGIENLRRGGHFIVFDAEGTFDLDRFQQMGGDSKSVIMIDPGTMEEAYDKLKRILDWAKKQEVPSNAVVLIAIDSMPRLIPAKMLESEGEDQFIGLQARINTQHLPIVDENMGANTALVILNQVRDKIGAMAWNADGNIDTPGGRVLKHLCSVRILFNKAGQIDNGQAKEKRQIMGMKTQAKVVKNKIAPPLRKATFNVMFDKRGVDNMTVLLNMGVECGMIKKGGAGMFTLKIGPDKVKQFRAAQFAEVLEKLPKTTAKLLGKIGQLEQLPPDFDRYKGQAEVVEEDD